jgi:cellulose synthase/poly-beta-1,6-N-acetylglucosamine synthase-like glycosyltransferase
MLLFLTYLGAAAWYYQFRCQILLGGLSYMLLLTELTFFLANIFMHYGLSMTGKKNVPRSTIDCPATCDIFITAYSEPVDCLIPTVRAALGQDWPVTVYVCDDGRNPELFKRLCLINSVSLAPPADFATGELRVEIGDGLVYLARVRGADHHAKAGNLNSALGQSHGTFVAILDSDMIASPQFVSRTISQFYKPDGFLRERVAFVQTPQRFSNVDCADPFAHNNSVFFDAICPARASRGIAPFAGSNAVFRRTILEQFGFQYGSITEDMLTGKVLHEAGYKSRYLAEPLAVGQAPDTMYDTVVQRMRWQMGSVQIALVCGRPDNGFGQNNDAILASGRLGPSLPRKMPGWRACLYRWVAYINSTAYSFSALATVVFCAVPVLSTAFCLDLADVPDFMELLYHFLPYLLLERFMTVWQCRRVSALDLWRETQINFWLAPGYIVGIAKVLARSRLTFRVTPKSEADNIEAAIGVPSEKPRVSWLLVPSVCMYFLALGSIGIGVARYMRDEFSGYNLLVATGFLLQICTLMWPAVQYSFISARAADHCILVGRAMYYVNTLAIVGYFVGIAVWQLLWKQHLADVND